MPHGGRGAPDVGGGNRGRLHRSVPLRGLASGFLTRSTARYSLTGRASGGRTGRTSSPRYGMGDASPLDRRSAPIGRAIGGRLCTHRMGTACKCKDNKHLRGTAEDAGGDSSADIRVIRAVLRRVLPEGGGIVGDGERTTTPVTDEKFRFRFRFGGAMKIRLSTRARSGLDLV